MPFLCDEALVVGFASVAALSRVDMGGQVYSQSFSVRITQRRRSVHALARVGLSRMPTKPNLFTARSISPKKRFDRPARLLRQGPHATEALWMEPLGPGDHVIGVRGPINDIVSPGGAVESQKWLR